MLWFVLLKVMFGSGPVDSALDPWSNGRKLRLHVLLEGCKLCGILVATHV